MLITAVPLMSVLEQDGGMFGFSRLTAPLLNSMAPTDADLGNGL